MVESNKNAEIGETKTGMSKDDIKELYAKTNAISTSFAELNGELKGVLPHLATKEDLSNTINTTMGKHVSGYHKVKDKISVMPKAPDNNNSLNIKLIGSLIGAIVALTGAVVFLSQ